MYRLLLLSFYLFICTCKMAAAQDMAAKAQAFIALLDNDQRKKALLDFNTEERYNFHYIPKDDRKGIALREMSKAQQQAALAMLKTCLSEKTVTKVNEITQLENVLKVIEKHPEEDHYRDPGKYFISLFGTPANNEIWGWRFEGHHISFNFSSENKQLVAGTPSFLGSNPAIVPDGPQKGKQVLKEETEMGFLLLNALSAEEKTKALINQEAPGEIITGASRKAMIDSPAGIRYSELSAASQKRLMGLLELYIHRYTKLFADQMMNEIKEAGLDKLWFTWAGTTNHEKGKAFYYRIQGPTIIVEYDNSQNNANHVHTVIRDLKNDFGGDMLLEHYKTSHPQ